MKNFNLIEMAKAMKEHKLRHMWRYAAMMALLLTLACGQAWGTSPLTVDAPSQNFYTQDGVTIAADPASYKINNVTSQAVFTTYDSASIYIYSQLTNITGISFKAAYKGSGSATSSFSLYASTGGAFAVPSSGVTATIDGNTLASLTNISLNGEAGSENTISVTFSSPVKAIILPTGSKSINVRNLSVSYDTGTQPSTYYAAHISGANIGTIDTDPGSASTTVATNSGQVTVGGKTFWKLNSGGITIDLGSGHTFSAGDQIVVEFAGSGKNKASSVVVNTGSGTPVATYNAGKIGTSFSSRYFYVVQASDGILGQQTAKITGGTDTRFYSYSVLRAANDCDEVDAPTSLSCTAQTQTSLTFGWTKASNASGYVAKLWDNSSCTGDAVATENIANGNTETVTFSGLTAGTTYYCKVQSKGDGTEFCAVGGTTSAANGTTDACTAISPTWSYPFSTVAVGITIYPTIGGNTGEGAVTYTSNNTSYIKVYDATPYLPYGYAAGSATITANVAASGVYCSGSVTSGTITVVSDQSGLIKQSLNYGNSTAWGTPSAPATSGTYASDITSTTAIAAYGTDYTIATTSNDGNNSNDGQTGKVPSLGSYDASKYVAISFTVASGKKLNVSAIYIPVQPVSKDYNNFKAVLTDDDDETDDIVGTISNIPNGKLAYIPFSSYGSVTGNVTLKIYAWGNDGKGNNWTAGYRFGKSIVIDGEIEEAPSSDCPSAYSFTYKNSSLAWSDPLCFTNTETSDGNGGYFWTAQCTLPTDGVSFKLGWEGKDDAGNASTTEVDFSYMPYDLQRSKTFGVQPTSSNTGGAEGYLRVRSSYGDNNKYIGFIPSGYVLRTGSGESWSSTNFVPASEDYYETDWSTPLTTLSSSTADKHYYVGLKTSSGYVWSNAYSEDWSRLIFLQTKGSASSGWRKDGAKMQLHYWKNGGGGADAYVIMTDADGDGVYEAWLPNASYDRVQFKRLSSDEKSVYNETGNLELQSDKNMYIIEENFTETGWGVYEQSGKFNIYANSNDKNWYLRFKPHYVLTYDANGGSNTMDKQSVAIDALSKSVTVASNGFTAPTGYTFAGWNPDEDDADVGTIDGDYDPSDNVTLSADMTLYAVWSPKEYTITLDDESATTSVSPGTVTATYNSSTIASITNPSMTGYTFGGWYSGDDGTGTLIIDTNGDLQANTAYTGAGGIWTNDDDVTLHAKWTVNTYDVTHTFSNVNRSSGGSGGTNAATYGVDYSVTVGANSGYTLPAGISVTIGGDATTHYTWSSGTVTVDGNYILGDVVITISGVPTYTVTYSLNGGEYNGSSTAPTQAAVTSGTSITLPSLTPTKDGYVFASWKCSVGNTYHWESYSYTMTAANTTFTAQWVAAADMEDGTLYTVDDIKPLSVNAALSSTGQYAKGISSNGIFTSIGNPLRTDNSDGTFEFKTEDKQTVDEVDFTKYMWFKGASNVTSNVPTSRGLKFSVASAGTLSVYCTRGDRISLSDGTNTPVALTDNTSGNIIRRDVTISDAGTYYLLSTNSNNNIAGMKFVATPACSTPADPDGLAAGSISSSGVTFTITDDESPASYEIYYSTDDDAPEASTPATTTTTSKSKAVTGLTVGTTYYAWVRSVCDEDHKSSWVAASSFSTLHQYAISYDKGEYGTGSISGGTKTEGTAFTLSSEKFTRSGYVQTGWALIDGGPKAYELGGSYTTDAAQTFYPVWGAVYTVTFNTNGTGSVSPITQSTYGGSISMPSGPSSTDSTFLYWVIGGNTYAASASYTPTSNITAYAAWKEKCSGGSTEIRFLSSKNDSGNAFASMSTSSNTTDYAGDGVAKLIAIGSASLDNSDNDKRGFRSEGRLDVVFKLSATSTLTIYVNQNGSTNRSYQLEGFSSVKSLTDIGTSDYSSGTSIVTSNITVTGDNFTGTSQAGSGSASSGVITISGKGGLKIIYSSLAAGYYVFKSTGSSSSYIWGFDLSGGSGGTCYYVKYDGNGAESGSINDATAYTSSSNSVTVLGNTGGNAFVRDGYTFNGWNTKANGSGDSKTAGGTFTITKDTVLYAQWLDAATTYTVSITANPAGYGTVSSSSVTSVASGTTLSTSTNTLSVGATNVTASATSASAEYTYAFSNWTKSDGTALPSTVTADLSVYANFTRSANSYTLTWNTNGGSDLDCDGCTSGSTAYGADITAPNDPTLSNYTFDGWKTNNDGSGTTAGSTMPAAATTYYAAWKQTVTLTTGAQGSGGNQTPIVYLNGTSVSDFTPHTASGYSLQGYYTAGSGGVKVLNADGSFAAANVTDYITSSKWSRTGAAPTLYAQWVASEDCSTSDFVIRKGDGTEYQGCMESSSYNGTATSFTAGSPTTVGKAKMTISTYSDGGIKRPGSGNTFSIVIEPVSGYYLKSICWAGKVESGETVSYYWDDNSGSAATISAQTTSGTGVTYNAPNSTTTKFTVSYVDDGVDGGGIWWRNVQVEVCAGGGTTYSVTYDDNGKTGGSVPTDDTDYNYGETVTVLGNTGSLAKTNYTFAGWSTNNDGTGSNYVEDNTFSITANTTLYAKWTQAVTLDKNGGSTDGSATAVWNATGLTGITHAKPASGYKLLGYYTAPTSGTKVLNSDGTFASTAVTDYITSGKWSRTGTAPTLYAQYESAGALTWNLIVNSDTANLSTSTKTSAFTEIAVANMTNAALEGGLTYTKGKKASLTGKISTPAYDAGKYVYVTFQVASGYKFIPSSIAVKVQPVGENEHKAVELSLADATNTLASSSATKCDGTSSGKTTTVTLAGNGTYFTGTVTLKIYVYPHGDATAASNNCYRLGTPITIEGEIEETCATMPSYTNMSYTTLDYTLGDTPSAISITGGTNINTYTWKQNTTNDRSGGSAVSTGTGYTTPSFTPSIASAGTTYYWCEMTNTSCGLTIKSPAVAVTVSASKSTASVTWDTKAKYNDTDTTAYYGGKNYTIAATLNSGWDGTLTSSMMTAPSGIRLHDFTIDDSSNPKTIKATFDVQTTFDIDENDSIAFTLSLPETTTYNALSSEKKVAYNECSGSGEGSSYNIRVRKAYTKVDNKYYWENTDGWISSPNPGSSISSGKAGTTMATVFDSVSSTNAEAVYVRTYHANIKKVRIYADFRANNMTVSNVYKHSDFFTANAKYAVEYTAVYNGDEENENLGTAAQGYVDITLNTVMSANDILLVKFNTSRVRPLGAVITEGSAGGQTTTLAFATTGTVAKTQSSANFTNTASPTGENANSLGAITYSSSNTSCATVNATTGEVTITATGTSNLSTTITATLAASGCFKKATTTYTITVPGVSCTIAAGTLTSDVTSKCSTEDATLTLAGFESGAIVQWYKGETTISTGGDYTITTDGTTSTLVTAVAGTYSVLVTNSAGTCSDRSNSITISNISATASVTKIVDEWYVKNGRLTPDITLWTMSEGATLKSVAWSPANETGLSCVARGGVIYLEGKSPSSNDSGADIEYTLTATITDECNTDHEETTKTIKITHQKNTDKHVLAFVVEGTAKGGFTAGITAAQTTNVDLYNTIAANFDVLATNIYSTDDEKKLKEYYSQFDILCITDYPNTKTKGVNSKSYVDAMGALVDIRPILTMEAWVSGLTNWKAKGISGTPSSPTTRQYTMLLQCKDHEIFSGTKLTKVGEGDETMYRISMVCDTLEDYKTLDATYGSGTHESDKNYQYGKKPALQGFTFTKEMLDDELLPLGLIDDGSGNDLQVGIERQTEMEARLMVLGINSYAMERLTDDGQTVVVNALKYLMKKNSEDIADCSNTFVGGDDEEDESTRYDWNVDSHWSGNAVPERTQKVRIVAPCVIKADEKFHVTGVVIAPSGKYNHGANTANGSLTIAAGGALIVDGKVEAATAPLYTETRATTPTDLILKTNSTAQSALIFDNEDGETQATVEMYSPSYWETVDGKKKKYWSYVAMPITEVPVGEYFYGAFTYLYSETSGWTKKGMYTTLYPFDGIGLSMQDGHKETFRGTLVSTENREITLTHGNAGKNMVGNSWTAPIQIANFDATDFGDATASVLIFNTGNNNEGTVIAEDGGSGTSTAGQWLTIPISVARLGGYTGLKVIPSMQAFQVNTPTETTLTLDYDKLVRDVAIASDNLTEPQRAPRKAKKDEVDIMRVRVNGENTHTDVWLLEDERFSDEFDNGWEAKYVACDDRSAQLYAVGEPGKMAFIALPDLDGTVLGFAPSRDGNTYQFTFHYVGDEDYYLNDLKLKKSVLISEEDSYSFLYEEGDTNRFFISRTRIDAPQTPTGCESVGAEAAKVRKLIINDKVYIIRGGCMYSVDGQMVK